MIGGFGNLTGEVDFWALEKRQQLGQTKAYCSVGMEWAADGTHLMTSVLYERVKVDNMISIFTPGGCKLLGKGENFEALHYAAWQPLPGKFKKPDIRIFEKEAEAEAGKKPKRTFVMPGGNNSTFSQLMRQEMGKANDQGPRNLTAASKQEYKDVSTVQANIAKEKTQ